MGNNNEASNLLDKIIKLHPVFYLAWFRLARLYSKQNDKAAMLKSLKKSIELNRKCKLIADTTEDIKDYRNDQDFLSLVK